MVRSWNALALKTILGVGFGTCLLIQAILVPGLAKSLAAQYPEYDALQVPMALLAAAMVVCVQVIVVAVWRLIGMTRTGNIFQPKSMRWVNAISWAILALLLLTIIFIVTDVILGIGPISVPVAALIFLVSLFGLWCLMSVMTVLLRQATDLRREADNTI